MTHKKHSHTETHSGVQFRKEPPVSFADADSERKKLEIVVKSDSSGSEEAVLASLSTLNVPGVEVNVIQADVGSVSKSDLLMAGTGSKLVIGFGVDTMPKLEELSKEQGIEVRLYDVIYTLTNDLRKIAARLVAEEEEIITGRAKVIALFKSRPGGIILGCEVLAGTLALGKRFRVIGAMGGPMYTGVIESLHIEKDAVKEAAVGHQVGVKIRDFDKAKIGDLVECFEMRKPKGGGPWYPKGGVFRVSG